MHKIEVTAVGHVAPHRVFGTVVRDLPYLVPAHLRHFVTAAVGLQLASQLKLEHLAMDQPQARRVAFGAVIEQHLHAHAHAKQRLAGRSFQHRGLQARLAQLAHAVGHGPLPWQHHALGGAHHVRVLRDDHLKTGATGGGLHRLRHRTQVAHAVINHGNGLAQFAIYY